jgi:glyoxylase-like metal-dependent hydrolase (beta-lactamase superfamily II)
MKVHHLDCCTMCPLGGRWVNGDALPWQAAKMVGHVLLVEGSTGLALVDTGIGTADLADRNRLGAGFWAFARPRAAPEQTALRQVEALGFKASDVRDLVVTHLDVDHAGGVPDFPHATVHVLAAEHAAAVGQGGFHDRLRYRSAHWAHGPRWKLHEAAGEPWLGFPCVREVTAEILMVPLVGHSRGHAGVAVRTADGWLLHAGDAYFHPGELADPPSVTPGLSAFERFTGVDWPAVLANQARLRELRRGNADVTVFSAHDPSEFAALAAHG